MSFCPRDSLLWSYIMPIGRYTQCDTEFNIANMVSLKGNKVCYILVTTIRAYVSIYRYP